MGGNTVTATLEANPSHLETVTWLRWWADLVPVILKGILKDQIVSPGN